MKRLVWVGLLASIVAIGCGDDEGDTLTEAEAQQVFAAISDGFTDTTEALDTETGSGLVNCPDGGSISASGSVNDTNNFNVVARYDNCRSGNVTIDGAVTITGNGSETSLNFVISGSITVTGEVTGTCSIDMTFSSSETSGFQVSGTVCGQNVADLGADSSG